MARNNQCDSCGGSLEYSPKDGNLVCKKCGKIIVFESSDEYKTHAFDMNVDIVEPDFEPKVQTLHCASCGAIFKAENVNMSATCTYCGSNLVMDFTLNNSSKPDGCIPFLFDKDEARKKFQDTINKKFFISNKLKKQLPKAKIESVYIPSYLFDIETDNDYYGRIYESSRDSNGNSERRYRKISGNKRVKTENIIVECSSQINQLNLDNIRPFDLSQLKKYKDEFLMGYSVEYYDKKLQECKSIIKESVKYDVRREILKGYRYDGVDYLDIKSNYVGCKYSRIILPTYRITYKSGSREYKSYMNGQTGKVGGYIPRSIFKIFMLVFGIIAGISLIAYLFMK